MIETRAASTDPDYCSTGDVLALLYGATTTDVVGSTQELDALGRLVRRASGWAQSNIGVPSPVATYRETVPAYGDRWLRLSQTPIRAVLAVYDATDTGAATALTTGVILESAGAGLLARDRGFAATNPAVWTGIGGSLGLTGTVLPGMETRPYLIDYVAGWVPLGGLSTDSLNYSTQATSTGATIPDEVQHGVALKVLELRGNPQGVRSRRLGDLAVEYGSAGPTGAISPAEDWLAPFAVRVA